MANTPSNMLPLGTVAPDFSLHDTVSDRTYNLLQLKGESGTVVMFICNHCPFVKHVNPEITQLAKDYQSKGFSFIAISSNDVDKYPQDGPLYMKKTALKEGYTFPYLYDSTQDVAMAYQAACTPDFYVFDTKLELVYRGQLDDSRPGNGVPLTGKDIRDTLEALISGAAISEFQKPSIGCNIKWKPN